MNIRRIPLTLILLAIVIQLSACSAVSIKQYGANDPSPLCREDRPADKLAVYWGTAWRADQKEKSLRGHMAEQQIEGFFRSNRCFDVLELANTVTGKNVMLATDSQVIEAAKRLGADRAFVIRVEELGPNLMLYLSPILWETKNEVLVRLRSIDVRNNEIDADITAHWFRGGPFTAHGADELPADLVGALSSMIYGRDAG